MIEFEPFQAGHLTLITGVGEGPHAVGRVLHDLRQPLAGEQVVVVTDDDIDTLESKDSWQTGPGHASASRYAFPASLSSLVSELSAGGGNDTKSPSAVVVSSRLTGSQILGTADAECLRPWAESAIAHVLDAFAPLAVCLVFVTRRQDRLMEWSYAREVATGATHRFEEQFPYGDRPVFDYVPLLERLSNMERVDQVRAVPAELLMAGTKPFMSFLLPLAGISLPADPVNWPRVRLGDLAPCSGKGITIAQTLGPHLESSRQRTQMKRFLARQFPAKAAGTTIFRPAFRSRIIRWYRRRNEQLFGYFVPDLDIRGYSSPKHTSRMIHGFATKTSYRVRGAGHMRRLHRRLRAVGGRMRRVASSRR